MKQKDIALIIVIAAVSGAIALVLSNLLISAPKNRQVQVEVVDKLSADFPTPDNKYFNRDSVNPTQLIQIGNSNNTQPFKN